MRSSVILFVDSRKRAEALQRAHNPQALRVLPIWSHTADRADSVIIEIPLNMTPDKSERFYDWCEQAAPAYIASGDGDRIVYLG